MDVRIVDFERPPVSEVVCGIGFDSLSNYSAPQMGLFWSEVIEEFPHAEIKAPIFSLGPDPGITISSEEFPTPRFFLKNSMGDELIQLQEDRFLFNWIKTDPQKEYPQYQYLITRFNDLRRKFGQFLRKYEIGPLMVRELHLAYVNHIPEGQGWSTFKDVGKIFPSFKLDGRKFRYLSKEPRGWNFTIHYPIKDEKSRMEISIRPWSRQVGEGKDERLFIFQLSVFGNVVDPSPEEIQRWFDLAREAINLSFLDLTSEKSQKEVWGIHER